MLHGCMVQQYGSCSMVQQQTKSHIFGDITKSLYLSTHMRTITLMMNTVETRIKEHKL